MIQSVPLADLVEDMAIYPRGSVSDIHVADLVYALEAGAQLPAPVADKDTMKLVDGFHRTRAMRKHLGAGASVDVDVQEFADDAAMLLASARLNSPQGLPLSRYDQRAVTIKARALGADDTMIAQAIGVTVARLQQISIRVVKGDDGDHPNKRGMEHLSGNYLSQEQLAEIRRQRGAPARSKVTELTRLLQRDLAPLDQDPELRLALAALVQVITEKLSAYP